MDPISLLITLSGLIVLIILYIMSRLYRKDVGNQNGIMKIPPYSDAEGNRLTSILADIPAKDGSTPLLRPSADSSEVDENKASDNPFPPPEIQLVLFIAADNEKGLDGNMVLKSLEEQGLYFGDMDIFHYPADDEEKDSSLFRVANGVKPWTLQPQDLKDSYTPGLSILMNLPTSIDQHIAISKFVSISRKLAKSMDASLKNQSQTLFTDEDEAKMKLVAEQYT
jgi:cell division protein ZipA